MATYSISGNVGIGSGSGVVNIQCKPLNSQSPSTTLYSSNDSTGAYTFSGLVPGLYVISADSRDISSGANVGVVYRQPLSVQIVASNIMGVNLIPTALNSSNAIES